MAGKYKLMRSANSQFYFNLVADNNEVVLTSETYWAKQGALNGIESVRINSPIDSRYQRKVSSRGKFIFNLTAANNEVIGKSEEYNTVEAREHGISVVKRIGPSATVDDLT